MAVGYCVGLDVGTTFSAAAIARDGRVEIVSLAHHAAAIPTLLFLKEDGTFLVGEAAARRGLVEPTRLARHFKRRFGDSTPLLLGGAPWSADSLLSQMLRYLVAAVTEQEGAAPDSVAVTHPANWGPFKTDLLRQAIRSADLGGAKVLTEPEAAATYYASLERIEPDEVVAIYDLGGGTFDATILRKSQRSFELLGEPEGIERLGGIDFDSAVLSHVSGFIGPALAELDMDDPVALAAMARLQADCVEAKEGLSADTEVSIPVMLPSVQTEIRLTRAEFETMIRPTLSETTAALLRAVRSSGVETSEVRAVLLVGGSSRIPLVGQLVGSEIGRPIAIDVHPKHAVALGAALAAGDAANHPRPANDRSIDGAPVEPDLPVADSPAVPASNPDMAPTAGAAEPERQAGKVPESPRRQPPVTPPPADPPIVASSTARRTSTRRRMVIAGIGAVLVIVVVVGLFVMAGGKKNNGGPLCQYSDAGTGAPITAARGSTFTDSLNQKYRVGNDCSLTPTN